MQKIVGITGATGLIGTHLRALLLASGSSHYRVKVISQEDLKDKEVASSVLSSVDVLIHLAAVNRAKNEEDYSINGQLAERLVAALEEKKTTIPIYYSSSIHISGDSVYGRSKLTAQKILQNWGNQWNCPVRVDVLPHVFGPWGRPYHNSVVHTFCHQMVAGAEIMVTHGGKVELISAHQVAERIKSFIDNPKGNTETVKGIPLSVAELFDKLLDFKDNYLIQGIIPQLDTALDEELFNTFRSFLYPGKAKRSLKIHQDNRGILSEIIRENTGGQIFFSTTEPGVERGNHFHLRKIERFCVLKGEAVVKIRKLFSNEIWEYFVNGNDLSTIDIPTHCTHSIQNMGSQPLLTLFWADEFYDPNNADTFAESVEKKGPLQEHVSFRSP